MEKKDIIKYYELETLDGPLFIYSRYTLDSTLSDSKENYVTRELFTGLKGELGNNTISFLDGKCVFKTRHEDEFGTIIYLKELRPSEFLGSISPYLQDRNTLLRKREEVLNILEFNGRVIDYLVTKDVPSDGSLEDKDILANKLLKKYLY